MVERLRQRHLRHGQVGDGDIKTITAGVSWRGRGKWGEREMVISPAQWTQWTQMVISFENFLSRSLSWISWGWCQLSSTQHPGWRESVLCPVIIVISPGLDMTPSPSLNTIHPYCIIFWYRGPCPESCQAPDMPTSLYGLSLVSLMPWIHLIGE